MEDIVTIRARVGDGNGLSPKDAAALALAYDEMKMRYHSALQELNQVKAMLEHLEELRSREVKDR